MTKKKQYIQRTVEVVERNAFTERTVDGGWDNPVCIRDRAVGYAVGLHAFSGDASKMLAVARDIEAFINEGVVPPPTEDPK